MTVKKTRSLEELASQPASFSYSRAHVEELPGGRSTKEWLPSLNDERSAASVRSVMANPHRRGAELHEDDIL